MIINTDLFAFFRSKALERAATTTAYYNKAIRSLEEFLSTLNDSSIFPSEDVIVKWVLYLYICQFSTKSILLYFNSISALYRDALKEGIVPKNNIFGQLKPKIITVLDKSSVLDNDFHKLKVMMSSVQHLSGDAQIADDIITLSLLTGCRRSVKDIAALKKQDLLDTNKELSIILKRNINPRRKYIFNLHQHRLTIRQFEECVQNITSNLLIQYHIRQFGSMQDTLESYWAYAALLVGVSANKIVGYLGHAPKGIPLLSLCKPEYNGIDYVSITEIGSSLIKNPLRWYAMHLRYKVTYEELVERLSSIEGLTVPELFYPLNKIAKRIKKKLVFEEQPVISNIVFFHTRITDIIPLFRHISDLAWCYTTSGKYGTQYAAISDVSFHRFQEMIGHFTEDYESQISTNTISEGTDVKVSAGLFAGIEASLEKVETTDGNSILQLLYRSDNNFKWTVGIDHRLVIPKQRE